MKKVIIAIIYVLSLQSCNNHCKEDIEFKEMYFEMLDTIKSYGKEYDRSSNRELWFLPDRCYRFMDYVGYLALLTGFELRYNIVGSIPIYNSQSDLKADIRDLKGWYKMNKCGMTIAKADSILNSKYEQAMGIKDSLFYLSFEVPRPR